MQHSVFDPNAQVDNAGLKIIAALERLSEGFRVLLWEKSKVLGISPIQIQILIFVHYHSDENCKVSFLAQEFNLSKPTVSEAVKSLEQKGMIERQTDSVDTRSHTIHLTAEGQAVVAQTEHFANPMLQGLAYVSAAEKSLLLEQLLRLIGQFQAAGIISLQRMCFSCRFYQPKNGDHFCQFLNKTLADAALRLDCREFEAAEF